MEKSLEPSSHSDEEAHHKEARKEGGMGLGVECTGFWELGKMVPSRCSHRVSISPFRTVGIVSINAMEADSCEGATSKGEEIKREKSGK